MKIDNVRFIKSATAPADFPDPELPEFAFIGKSNSGKSSLINMLTGRKRLVVTGATPGVTRTVNFFLINENISLADLPGFGYAKLSKKMRDSFQDMIKNYINSGRRIMIAFVLIDIRRDPGEAEKDILEKLNNAGVPTALILTKSDKLTKGKHKQRVKEIAQYLDIGEEAIIISSAKNGTGRKELLAVLSSYSHRKQTHN